MEPQLKYENVKFIHYQELDKFAAVYLEPFDRDDWNVMDAENMYSSSTCVIFDVGPNEVIDMWADHNFGKWLTGGDYIDEDDCSCYYPDTRVLMQWLFEQDKVDSGRYVVEISW